MKISVDESRCVASGQCAMIAPTVFDQDEEDGTVILLQSQPPDEFGELVRRAEQVCPALAIRVAG